MEPITLLFLFIWVAAAVAIGSDAQERGMNPYVWGIATFLFPLGAVLMYLVVRKPRRG